MTRMGAAIRHAAHLTADEKHHSQRLILPLSDGIGCVCLNVGSQQDDDVLKRLHGRSTYLRCADAAHAVPALRRLMRGALKAT